jgi:hypothetical protein
MNAKTAREAARGFGAIRAALAEATDEERAVIAATLQSLLAKAEVKPATKPAAAKAVTADSVNAAARKIIADGRGWGDSKAYICDVASELGTTTAAIKAQLVELNRRGEISLSRADLIEAMDACKVAESHLAHLGADFHFVQVG